MTWYSFDVDLPADQDWKGATFTVASVWGNGNANIEHWGWPVVAAINVSNPIQYPGSNRYHTTVDLIDEGAATPVNGHVFAFTARATLQDGKDAVVAAYHIKT